MVRRPKDCQGRRRGIHRREVQGRFRGAGAEGVCGLSAELHGGVGHKVGGQGAGQPVAGPGVKVGAHRQTAQANHNHVGNPDIIGSTDPQRKGLAGCDRAFGRDAAGQEDCGWLVGNYGNRELTHWTVIPKPVSSNGTEGHRPAHRQRRIDPVRRRADRADSHKILRKPHAATGLRCGEHSLDRNGTPGNRGPIFRQAQTCNRGTDRIEGVKTENKRLADGQVAGQIANASNGGAVMGIRV